jgi:hypothetical protein
MNFTKSILPVIAASLLFIYACGDNNAANDDSAAGNTEATASNQSEKHGNAIKAGDVTLTSPLNQEWVTSGKGIYDLKCQSCHKLSDERVVGPGWAGVTTRREPHWIMNMITNVDMMLETDPEAQKLLEQCLVRMPNQNITTDESRQILEFMRHNDGVK